MRTILITGGSSGIGQAIAIEAAKQGWQILFTYRSNEQGAKETLNEIKEHSSGRFYQTELSDPSSVTALFENIKNEHGSVDFLVNNAGKAHVGEFNDFELWEDQIKIYLYNVIYVSSAFLKLPPSSTPRKIINISSGYGIDYMTNPDYMHYSAVKAAVNNLTMSLAKKFAPDVLVNAIAPGYVWTPPWEGTPEAEIAEVKRLNKIGRFIEPSEIAQMAINILQNDAMTGEIVRVDGGLHLMDLI